MQILLLQNLGLICLVKKGITRWAMLKDKVTGQLLRAQDGLIACKYDPGQFVFIDQEDIEKIKKWLRSMGLYT